MIFVPFTLDGIFAFGQPPSNETAVHPGTTVVDHDDGSFLYSPSSLRALVDDARMLTASLGCIGTRRIIL